MQSKASLGEVLAAFDDLSPKGCVLAMHFRFNAAETLIQTYPVDWVNHYSQAGYVLRDPVVLFSVSDVGARRWSDLARDDEAGVLADAERYGLRYGVAVSHVGGKGAGGQGGQPGATTRSLCAVARDDREYDDAEIETLVALTARFHDLTADRAALAPEDAALLRAREMKTARRI
ncbi:MAG: autoinducer binding domain-containing protein [Shimia sp.]